MSEPVSNNQQQEQETLDTAIERAYTILVDIYHSGKIQNLSDAQLLTILNNTIQKQHLSIAPVTITELALFAELDVSKSNIKFGNNTKPELVASRSIKIDKLELIEKQLWSLASSNDLNAQEKAKVYGHLADVVLKEKELEDELVRLLD